MWGRIPETTSEIKKQSRSAGPRLTVRRGQHREFHRRKANEDQLDHHLRRRPGEGLALLHPGGRLREKGGRFARWVSVAHRGVARRPRWHRAAARAQ